MARLRGRASFVISSTMERAHSFIFGRFRFSARRIELTRDGVALPLGSRALEILLFLLRHSGAVAGKDSLMAAVWPDRIVEENNLTVPMSALRRAPGDGADGARYIRSEPGRGYRFVEPVRTATEDAVPKTAMPGGAVA